MLLLNVAKDMGLCFLKKGSGQIQSNTLPKDCLINYPVKSISVSSAILVVLNLAR